MTGQPSSQRLRDLPATLIKSRWVQLFLAVFALLELYNHGAIPAFISTQKGVETRAIAANAELRQKAEAELAEWKAIDQTRSQHVPITKAGVICICSIRWQGRASRCGQSRRKIFQE